MAWGGHRPGAGRPPEPGSRRQRRAETAAKSRPRDGAEIARERKFDAARAFSANMVARMSASRPRQFRRKDHPELNPFNLPEFPPGVVPKEALMAMDDQLGWAQGQWAANPFAPSLIADSLAFPGFAYLAELALRPEYRVISETIGDETTRKWVKFGAVSATQDKTEKIKELEAELKRLNVRDLFNKAARLDGFFGRSQMFPDLGYEWGNPDTDKELMTPIGEVKPGDATTEAKIKKGQLKSLKMIEPYWSYPQGFYGSSNPLSEDWYRPEHWQVMARSVHRTRLITFVGHEVPDIFKPAFAFGGLSLSQMAQPYVDIWLQTRESVGQLIHSFSVMCLGTNMGSLMSPGNLGNAGLVNRADYFNATRDNQGLFVYDKTTEDFKNISAPLGGLHELQAQSQEHMMAVARIPSVKFTGIQPSGLNACLTGDTLIETDQGKIQIKDVRPGQKVMTREGWAPVAKSGCTGYALELIEIRTSDSVIRCTANHLIWMPSTNAFVPAGNVRPGDLLLCHNITRKIATSGSDTASAEIVSVVASVRRMPAREFVYDIQVARGHLPEFFANGVCVHNSSDGEIRVFYDTINAYQEFFFRSRLETVVHLAMINIWGEIDEEITFTFVPLHALTEKEQAELDKLRAETDDLYVNGLNAIAPEEVRKKIAADPSSPYAGLDPDKMPPPPQQGEGAPGGEADPMAGLFEQIGKGGQEPDDGGGEPGRGGPDSDRGGNVNLRGTETPGGGRVNLRGHEAFGGGPEGGRGGEDADIVPFGRDAPDWREDDHPRGEGGKFTEGQGGGGGGGRKNEPAASAGGFHWFQDEPDSFYGVASPSLGKGGQAKYQPGVRASGLAERDEVVAGWRDAMPATVDALVEAAPRDHKQLADFCRQLERETGAKFSDPGPKTPARIADKVQRKGAPQDVTDAARGGFDVPTPEASEAIVRRLAEKFEVADEGWQRTPAGYFDRKVMVRFDDGLVGEVQMWAPGMLSTKNEKGHAIYEAWQKLPKDSPEKGRMLDAMAALYAGVEAALPDAWRPLIDSWHQFS